MSEDSWLTRALEMHLAAKEGRTNWSWELLLGDPGACPSLTSRGVEAMEGVAQTLTEFFGPTWLSLALAVQGFEAIEPVLHAASPVLTLRPTAYGMGRYLMWWACIELTSSMPSQSIVQREMRTDVTRSRFVHGMAQLRLAACARVAGHDPGLEDEEPGWEADVVVRDGHSSVPVEVATMKVDQVSADLNRAGTAHMNYAMDRARANRVGVRGEVPGILETGDEQAWRFAVSRASQQCAKQLEAIEVAFAGPGLIFTPDEQDVALEGPLIARDVTHRVVQRLRDKARQVDPACSPWIWLEDDGALGLVFDYRNADLAGKWERASAAFAPVLQDHPHLGGIALASYEIDDTRQHRDETMTLKRGAAVRCSPAPRSTRSTILVSKDGASAGPLTTLARAEGQLVNAALASAGIDSNLDGLFVQAS